jgi:hypothetical protein
MNYEILIFPGVKRCAPQPRQRGEVARTQSCLDEPAPDAVPLGCSNRRQHTGPRHAWRFCPVEERQDAGRAAKGSLSLQSGRGRKLPHRISQVQRADLLPGSILESITTTR